MLRLKKGLPYLVFILALGVASLSSANEHTENPVERLVQDFIVAFNTGDADTMADFYQHAASASFNERRTEKEDRDLYRKLVDKFGTLSYRAVELRGSEGARLLALASISGAVAEFRFKLVGKPSRIDGFSAGINPEDNVDMPGADAGPGTDLAMPGHDSEGGPFGFLVSEKKVYQEVSLLLLI